jgi:hypothetical protein
MLRTILAILGVIAAIAIVWFVFFSDRGGQRVATTNSIDIDEIKPPNWKPLDEKEKLILINLDDDVAVEWLFLYRDEYSTNQIGGMVYDAQNRPRGTEQVPVPSQAPVYLVPYRLMPDYSIQKNHGYLGDDRVIYKAVGPSPASSADGPQADLQGEFLFIQGQFRGRTNRFSVFWWIDAQRGYGGALATTPGWFSLSEQSPNDWDLWEDNEKLAALQSLWAWEPQTDRSNICRVVQWRLVSGGDPNVKSDVTRYFEADYDRGTLRFCRGAVPSEPAFPEGQVLAYLLDGNVGRWQGEAVPFGHVRVYHLSTPGYTDRPFERPVAEVDATFESQSGLRTVRFTVEMIQPNVISDPVRWRITSAHDLAGAP